jgi:hypothetical protein
MHPLIEVGLFAALLVGLTWLWLQVSALQHQVAHLRDQLDRHIARGHGQIVVPPPASVPRPAPPVPATPPLTNRPTSRRLLRLVKNP